MAEDGNPASVSDAGVGAMAARSAILGAELNVRINANQLTDKEKAERIIRHARMFAETAEAEEKVVLAIVNSKL